MEHIAKKTFSIDIFRYHNPPPLNMTPPPKQENTPGRSNNDRGLDEFLVNRYKRLHPGKMVPGGLAPGWDSSPAGIRAIAVAREALTPAETSLLKSLTAKGAGAGGGVAGVAGLERLMRVMVNAPDVSLEGWGN